MIDPRLVEIVDRATSANPEDRFTDARDVVAALDDFAVGERAANRGESPARQLAAWLDAVWGTEREDVGPDGEIDAQHMLSFLDDGGLDVMGTGTQRSLLATAADDTRDSHPAITDQSPTPEKPAPPEPTQSTPRDTSLEAKTTRRIILVGVAAFAIVATVVVMLVVRGQRRAAALQADASVAILDTAVPLSPDALAEMPGDAAPVRDAVVAETTPDAAIEAPPDAPIAEAPRDAGVRRPRPDAAIVPARPDAAVTAAVTRRKVTINAIPWANFTVDGDPTQYQTIKTIELTPGAHVIHFANPVIDVTRDVTIDVPADRDMKHVERL